MSVTIRIYEALRDMYAADPTAEGDGYCNFAFNASDRNDTGNMLRFTADFIGDYKLRMGLMDLSYCPSIRIRRHAHQGQNAWTGTDTPCKTHANNLESKIF